MLDISTFTLILILVNLGVSYKGFSDRSFMDQYLFEVDAILRGKEYIRLISAGFLHANWVHLLFNMYALYMFSQVVEIGFGLGGFLLIYIGSLIGGNLLALFIHRFHGDYRALGASGAVSGVVFAFIALIPEGKISLILIPIGFPAWAFGIAYVLFSIYGIRSKRGNIGHEAHLGGAVVGLLLAVLLRPGLVLEHAWIIFLLLVPAIGFIVLIYQRPEILMLDRWSRPTRTVIKTTPRIRRKVKPRQKKKKTVDEILDKINREGMESLTPEERKLLDEYSGK